MREPRGQARATYHHGNLRQALIDGALALIAEQDITGLSLREVARRAGVARSAPYHHFRDKDALLATLAAEGFRALNQRIDDSVRGLRDPRGMAEAAAHAYIDFAIENPAQFRVMNRPEFAKLDQPEGREMHEVADGAFRRLLLMVQALDTEHCASDHELTTRAIAAWSTLHGFVRLWIEGPIERSIGPTDRMRLQRGVVDHAIQIASPART
jgi:AcrR family transcriptional regulator